jgi:hypothetical protein
MGIYGFRDNSMKLKSLEIDGNLTIKGDLDFGDVITDSFTCNGMFKMGTSSTPLVLTAGTPIFTLYTTNAGTSGSTSAEPFYVKNTLTGAGQVGGRSRFHCYSNVASGGWINALKAYMEFGASGSSTGIASAFCAETALSVGTSSGTYCALEGELILGASASTGTSTSFMYFNASGAGVDTFDTNGFLFEIGSGITGGSGKFFQENTAGDATHALKCKIDGSTYYLMLTTVGA